MSRFRARLKVTVRARISIWGVVRVGAKAWLVLLCWRNSSDRTPSLTFKVLRQTVKSLEGY